jgi:branched-chain amino acid transport system permease protein
LRPVQEVTGVDLRMMIYSLTLILLMILRPQGIFGSLEIAAWWKSWRRSRALRS